MTRIDDLTIDPDLDAHLRRTLRAVAATIEDDPADLALTALPPTGGDHAGVRPGRRRPAAAILVAAATVAAVGVGGWVVNRGAPAEVRVGSPSGQVVDGAPADAMMSGHAEGGGAWWLRPASAPTADGADCPPTSWVEFGTEKSHPPGWTGGVFGPLAYGDDTSTTAADWCKDEAAWLSDRSLFLLLSARTGWRDDPTSDWGVVAGVHPSVAQLRVTVGDGEAFTIDTVPVPARPHGPRFAAFTADAGATVALVELLRADGDVVTVVGTQFLDGWAAELELEPAEQEALRLGDEQEAAEAAAAALDRAVRERAALDGSAGNGG